MTQYLSKSAFAESQGWQPSYVTKLGKQGRLALAPDGKRVDVGATLALIGKTADPSKDGVREHHEKRRVQRDVYDAMDGQDSPAPSDYHVHKAEREKYLAGIARIEFDKASGQTVERQPVVDAAYRCGRMMRDSIMGLNKQLAPELAAMSDAWEIERMLNDRYRGALQEVIRLSQDDLNRAMETE